MLYVYFGTNSETAQRKAGATLQSLQKKAPQATTVRLIGEEVTAGSLLHALSEHSLFKSETILFIDVRDGGLEVVVDCAKECAESSNVVLLLAGKLLADPKKKLEKVAVKCHEFEKEKVPAEANMFILSDYLLNKDAKSLFVELEKMRLSGAKAEAVVGILFWAAKSMVLAGESKTAGDSGLKPFVFQKAKRGVEAWGNIAAKKLMSDLAHAPHAARGENLFNKIEAIILA